MSLTLINPRMFFDFKTEMTKEFEMTDIGKRNYNKNGDKVE